MTKSTTVTDQAFDILIIGSGAAGLTLALRAADFAQVAVLSKGDLNQGATFYAQGGIATVLDAEDSIASHVEDTLTAGVGLCDRDTVEYMLENSAETITWLIQQGVPFTTNAGAGKSRERTATDPCDLSSLHLTQEGGHSHRRIIHATDATGKAVFETLQARAQAHPNIHLIEACTAVDLVIQPTSQGNRRICVGSYVLNQRSNNIELIKSRFVVLATGGASKAYLYTTNPDGASGDGIAMAWRAGARVSNMEMMQFHPTCLYNLDVKNFLITEAVRGEGGRLLNPITGERYMKKYDPERMELAPRDIVARANDDQIKRHGLDYVHLDISHEPPEFVMEHFPTIHEKLLGLGIDMTKGPIPVVPAQHYTCGGVKIGLDAKTDLPGLWAAGECTESGLHGANRLASNSLLECFVFGEAAAKDILECWDKLDDPPEILSWDESRVTDSDEEVVIKQNWTEIRRFMWNYVGIVRTTKRLERAAHRIRLLRDEVEDYYGHFRVTTDLIELRNLLECADLIVSSALKRHESRGLHFILDYPETNPVGRDTVLVP